MPDIPNRPSVRGSSSPGTPGVGGALKDLAQSIMNNSQPSQTGSGGRARQATVDQTADEAVTGRMKQAQSSDRDNNYSY